MPSLGRSGATSDANSASRNFRAGAASFVSTLVRVRFSFLVLALLLRLATEHLGGIAVRVRTPVLLVRLCIELVWIWHWEVALGC